MLFYGCKCSKLLYMYNLYCKSSSKIGVGSHSELLRSLVLSSE